MATEFLKRMTTLYGAPSKTEDVSEFLHEYRHALAGYSDTVLSRAADRIRDTRKYRSWPTPAECREAADEAADAERVAAMPPPETKSTPDGPWSDELVAKVLWSNPDITNRAIDEGWIVGLHDFVRDRHRLPKKADFLDLRNASNYVRECAAGREDMGFFHTSLMAMADSFMDRRFALSEQFSRMTGERE